MRSQTRLICPEEDLPPPPSLLLFCESRIPAMEKNKAKEMVQECQGFLLLLFVFPAINRVNQGTPSEVTFAQKREVGRGQTFHAEEPPSTET